MKLFQEYRWPVRLSLTDENELLVRYRKRIKSTCYGFVHEFFVVVVLDCSMTCKHHFNTVMTFQVMRAVLSNLISYIETKSHSHSDRKKGNK